MSCIVLIGGGIGCGKSTLINYIQENKTYLFEDLYKIVDYNETGCNTRNKIDVHCCVIQFDNLCSIEEQEHLMKSLRGLKHFRADLLMAAERFITLLCNSESGIIGPLTQRSYNLLLKLKEINNFCSSESCYKIIFVEDNFYYRSMRYDWFQIAKRTNLGFATIFLHCPLNIAIDRNSNRGYEIPEDRIKKMLSFLEFPDPAKFKWEKMSVILDSSTELTNIGLIDVISIIIEALKNPVELVVSEEKIEARKICSKNVIHQSDRILRKIVSKIISDLKVVYIDEDEEENFKTIVSNLVNIRQKLLCDIKEGTVILPEDLVEKIQNLGIESVLDAYEERLQKMFMTTLEGKVMFTVFSGVKAILKCKKLHIDQCIFRLHYKVSFFILLASCALVGSKQYGGEPIKCGHGLKEYSPLIEVYCFITSTYSIRTNVTRLIHTYRGSYFPHNPKDLHYYTYYQWTGFLLFFQGLMFYFPHWLWKCFEGGELTRILEKEVCDLKDPDIIRLRYKNKIVNSIRNRWKQERWYCFKYFVCEFLCLVNVVGQMFLLDAVFDNLYLSLGIDAVAFFRNGSAVAEEDPLQRLFPRMTSCLYSYYGPGGGIVKKSVLCVLAVNAINEKIFLFFWFWLIILFFVTSFAFIYKLILFSSYHLRFSLLKYSFRIVNQNHLRFIVENGNAGDYLFMYLLGQNLDQSLFKDVIVELVSRYQPKGY